MSRKFYKLADNFFLNFGELQGQVIYFDDLCEELSLRKLDKSFRKMKIDGHKKSHSDQLRERLMLLAVAGKH